MICPIMSESNYNHQCDKEGCAWWDEITKQCCIKKYCN